MLFYFFIINDKIMGKEVIMKIYNTLTKKIEEFAPHNKDRVTFYSCGPTVYH